MKNAQTTIIAALLAFIVGFAVSWIIKPAEVRVVEVGAPVQSQDQPEDQPSENTSSEKPQHSEESAQPSASADGLVRDGNTAHDPYTGATVTQGESYSTKDEVSLYIYAFGDVPSNYITKSQARKKGWVANEGNLWDVLPGMSIGGGGFDNIEGEIPLTYDPDRTFKECDINYEGGYRGAERLVWSDDGYIFYTPDHYESFEQLYPHEEG